MNDVTPRTGKRRGLRRHPWLIPLALGAAGLALRLLRLGASSYYFDEAVTVLVARDWSFAGPDGAFPLTEPPLFALLMKAWLAAAGTVGEAWARLPGALASAAVLPLFYLLARAWLDRSAAVLALALAATAPYQIAYAQEARMYSLLVVLALAATLLLRAAARHQRPGAWVAYAAVTALGGMLHFGHLLILPAHGIMAVTAVPERPAARRRIPLSFTVAAAAGAAPALAWLSLSGANFAHAIAHPVEKSRPSLALLLEALELQGAGPLLPPGLTVIGLLAFSAAFAPGLLRAPARGRLPLATLALLPVALLHALTGMGMLHAPLLRYVIGVHPFFLMLCAAGVASLPRTAARAAGAGLLALNAVAVFHYHSGHSAWRGLYPDRKPLRAVAAAVRAGLRPGDAVVHIAPASYAPFRVYLSPVVPQSYLMKDPSVPSSLERFLGSPSGLEDALAGRRRVWLVVSPVRFGTPPRVDARFRPALERCCSTPERRSFPGVDLYLARVKEECR